MRGGGGGKWETICLPPAPQVPMALYFRKQDLSCAGAFLFKGTLISEVTFQFGPILKKIERNHCPHLFQFSLKS